MKYTKEQRLDIGHRIYDGEISRYEAAEEYGIVRTELEKAGQPICPLDTQIAAHARSLGLTLVTNNTRNLKEFLN